MTSRRRNPSRACKAPSNPPVADIDSDSESSAEDGGAEFQEMQKRNIKQRKKRAKRVTNESEDSSFSVHPSEDEEMPEHEYKLPVTPEAPPSSTDEMSEEEKPPPREKKRRKTTSSRAKASSSTRSAKSTQAALQDTSTEAAPNGNALSEKQEELLTRVFRVFDTNGNDRITLTDIIRVADDHGVILTTDEARDMLRFWDASGTGTISRKSFSDIALDCKFMAPVGAKK